MNSLYLAFFYYSYEKRKVDARIFHDKETPNTFYPYMFYQNSRMRTRKNRVRWPRCWAFYPHQNTISHRLAR